jgi:hypothetical protein
MPRGAPQAGDSDRQWPHDLERLQKQYFASDDQLLTLRMFSGPDRDNWIVARRLGLRITGEFNGPRAAELIEPFVARAATCSRSWATRQISLLKSSS